MFGSPDGVYAVYVTGHSGSDLVLLVMKGGIIAGANPMGVIFDGDYHADIDGQHYSAKVIVKVPPEGMTVQGVSSGPPGIAYEVRHNLPANFDKFEFLTIDTPLGPVNAKFQKLRPLNND